MRQWSAAVWVILCLGGLASAGPMDAGLCDDLSAVPIRFDVDWSRDIKPIINELISEQGKCTSCHGPGSGTGLDLTDTGFDAIYKVVNSYVIPGDPAASLLFLKVNCELPPIGERMPLTSQPLTIAEQALIYDWIAGGALGEPPDEPIFRDFMIADGMESLRRMIGLQ